MLTRAEHRFLRYYRDHRERTPTLADFFSRSLRILAVWIPCAVLAVWACSELQSYETAYLAVGMFLGAYLANFGRFMWAKQVWPIAVEITHWQRVEELLLADEDSENYSKTDDFAHD
jgi:hypothetical protein